MQTSRRIFLQATSLATASSLGARASASANERVRVAVIGVGGQGKGHLNAWKSLQNVEVVAICDVDESHRGQGAQIVPGAKAVADLRRVLDDRSIDAVSIATPDHWHTPAALLAMEAGKHVYIEKPCSHNVREGRMLVEASKRHGKIVQHGTQSRSARFIRDAMELLRSGVIGDILVARAWDVQFRPAIGHGKPSTPPSGFDYETWVGPASFVPFQSNRHHYTWHWWRHFGTGDAGNDGVHELDIARWGLGIETHPSTVTAIGGKYFHDDDQEFPDTMTAIFEYPGNGQVKQRKQLIFELRLWSHYHPETTDNGNEFLGTEGRLYLAKSGDLKVFDRTGKPRSIELTKDRKISVATHMQNFLDGIRNGSPVNADAHTAHLSATLPHLANTSARLGRSLHFDPVKEVFLKDDEANALLGRTYREGHWAAPKV